MLGQSWTARGAIRDPSARPPPASLPRQLLPPSVRPHICCRYLGLGFCDRSGAAPGLDTPEQIASPVAPRRPLTDSKIGSRAQITREA